MTSLTYLKREIVALSDSAVTLPGLPVSFRGNEQFDAASTTCLLTSINPSLYLAVANEVSSEVAPLSEE